MHRCSLLGYTGAGPIHAAPHDRFVIACGRNADSNRSDLGNIDHGQCEGRQAAARPFAHGLATRHSCRHRRRHVERLARLVGAVAEGENCRVAYDGKDIEIMNVGPVHDSYSEILGLFINLVAEELQIDLRGRDRQRGGAGN